MNARWNSADLTRSAKGPKNTQARPLRPPEPPAAPMEPPPPEEAVEPTPSVEPWKLNYHVAAYHYEDGLRRVVFTGVPVSHVASFLLYCQQYKP